MARLVRLTGFPKLKAGENIECSTVAAMLRAERPVMEMVLDLQTVTEAAVQRTNSGDSDSEASSTTDMDDSLYSCLAYWCVRKTLNGLPQEQRDLLDDAYTKHGLDNYIEFSEERHLCTAACYNRIKRAAKKICAASNQALSSLPHFSMPVETATEDREEASGKVSKVS